MAKKAADIADGNVIKIEDVITAAVKIPGVRIDREQYLKGMLNSRISERQLELVLTTTPAKETMK